MQERRRVDSCLRLRRRMCDTGNEYVNLYIDGDEDWEAVKAAFRVALRMVRHVYQPRIRRPEWRVSVLTRGQPLPVQLEHPQRTFAPDQDQECDGFFY